MYFKQSLEFSALLPVLETEGKGVYAHDGG